MQDFRDFAVTEYFGAHREKKLVEKKNLALHRLQNRCKWEFQTGANTFVSTSVETKKMHMQKQEFSSLEIDLLSRLQTMKIFF
jgi:hypothetical protein